MNRSIGLFLSIIVSKSRPCVYVLISAPYLVRVRFKINDEVALSSIRTMFLPCRESSKSSYPTSETSLGSNFIWKLKFEPSPFTLSTLILPSMSSTSLLHILSPNPVPPYLRPIELSSWMKDLKIDSFLASSMPTPVSITSKKNCELLYSSCLILRVI